MLKAARRVVIAAIVGNVLEWYDFILYGLFARQIAAAFFPARSEIISLLLAAATFGVGFVPRPAGAFVLGRYADRHGRKAAMTLIIAVMTAATALIVLTPGYAAIGLAAPVLIVAARLAQGFSAGGEFGAATAMLVEAAPAQRRFVYASWQGVSQKIAFLAGSAAAAIAAYACTPAELGAWGWRAPFALGLLIGPFGLWMRARIVEPPRAAAPHEPEPGSLRALWRGHRIAVLRAIGIVSMLTAATYVFGLNMPAYAQRELGMRAGQTFAANVIANAVSLPIGIWAAQLADRFGPRRIILPGVAALGIAAAGGFYVLTASPGFAMLTAVQTVLLALLAFASGPAFGFIGGLFPATVRASGMAIAYSVSVMIFGGFASFITTALIALTGNRLMPGLYVTAGAVLTIAALTPGKTDPARE